MQIKKIPVTPVILCGGSGRRLWPLSRTGFPKQFLVLTGKTSLFQQTIERTNSLNSNEIFLGETLIVTNEICRFLALDQLRELPLVSSRIILEPEGKNTAPALTLAALKAIQNGEDPVLVVTPSDHAITDKKIFVQALQRSIKVAAEGAIVVLGIKPSHPETGFGYIKFKPNSEGLDEFEVDLFVEKPKLETAQQYLASGNYFWNSGIFVLRASLWLKALKNFRPDIEATTRQAFSKAREDYQFTRPERELFKEIPNESIDYAVIEKCPNSKFVIKMIPFNSKWSDLGAWSAVWQIGDRNDKDNLICGDVLAEETTNSLIYADHRLVSVVGLDNVVVIETADAVLVTARNRSQQVKDIVSQLIESGREESQLHRKVYRPWGWYDTIELGDHFKVKRIKVNPGASLSLQKHLKRAEHWVVVKGLAKVTSGKRIIFLKENESSFIPIGQKHRLSNPTDEPLEIIEIQTGFCLDESDIIRYDDNYGRADFEL